MSAREEMDQLFDEVFRMPRHLLEKNKAFYPTGAWILADGELAFVGVGLDDPVRPTEVLELLVSAMQSKAAEGAIRGAAAAVDVLAIPPGAPEKTDAVMVSIEHAEADPVDVLTPYTKRRLGRGFEFGESWAQAGERRVFPRP